MIRTGLPGFGLSICHRFIGTDINGVYRSAHKSRNPEKKSSRAVTNRSTTLQHVSTRWQLSDFRQQSCTVILNLIYRRTMTNADIVGYERLGYFDIDLFRMNHEKPVERAWIPRFTFRALCSHDLSVREVYPGFISRVPLIAHKYPHFIEIWLARRYDRESPLQQAELVNRRVLSSCGWYISITARTKQSIGDFLTSRSC